MEQEHQFIDYIEQSIIKNWDRDALTDYKGITRVSRNLVGIRI